MSGQMTLGLPPSRRSETIVINARCTLRIEDEHCVVVVAGLVVHSYNAADPISEAHAMVLLVDAGYAQQNEVARAFGCSERTVRRHQRRYAQGGMAELGRSDGWRPGRRRIERKRLRVIERLKADGISNREIARRLGVTENAIRKQVGPSKEAVQQILFAEHADEVQKDKSTEQNSMEQAPNVTSNVRATGSDTSDKTDSSIADENEELDYQETNPISMDRDPSDRSFDRLLACFGLLNDAAPLFRTGCDVAGAGVLFAIPLFVQSGIFRVSRKLYGEIGPAFYGLRTTFMALLLMSLLRINRAEHLKEHNPAELGRLLGLDRAPEVKTVRRKLTRLAACLHELFASCGDISVTDDTLLVSLSPLSSPHRTQAVQELCEPLNNTDTKYPGTNLRIRFEVRPPPRIGLAFPGPAPERVQKTTSDTS